MGQSNVRVVIADDHASLRRGLAELLHQQADFVVVGEAGDGTEAVSLVQRLIPDILILDLLMPVMDGVAVMQALRENKIDIPVLVFTVAKDPQMEALMGDLGAYGYLTKDASQETIVDAVRRVCRREKVFPNHFSPHPPPGS